MPQSFNSFDEFWAFYLRAHAKPLTRALHIAGTMLSFAFLAAALAALGSDPGSPLSWLIGAALAACALTAYGFAWIGHFVFEGNRPATFEHPLWSLLADLRMCGYGLRGPSSRSSKGPGSHGDIRDNELNRAGHLFRSIPEPPKQRSSQGNAYALSRSGKAPRSSPRVN